MNKNSRDILDFVKEEFFSVTKNELTDLGNFLKEYLPDELATAHARIIALEAALKDVTEGYIHETATGWGVPRVQVENSPLVKLARAALEKTT